MASDPNVPVGPCPAGHRMLRFVDPGRDRSILVDLWYPAVASAPEREHRYGLTVGLVAEGAGIAAGRHPLVVTSHGAYGSAGNYSWIAEHLARNGYLIVGVSHPGESPMYGPESLDPTAALRPWLRPEDCSFVLGELRGDDELGPSVDATRIAALGHSSGGATVIELGGARYDPDLMAAYCASDVAALDLGCAYARGLPATIPAVAAGGAAWTRHDPRVRAIVALDPALGPGHDTEALTAVTVPILVVGAVENDFLPFDAHAGHYARHLPGAELIELTGGEGHFVYLDRCAGDLAANGVSLCRDRPGVDRAAVHARLAGRITAFLDDRLGRTTGDEGAPSGPA